MAVKTPARVTQTLNAARVPGVVFWGDSIPYGVHNQTLAGPRERLYNLGQAAGAGGKFFFQGTQSFAGNGGGLAADPFCQCFPGITLATLTTLTFQQIPFYPQVSIIWGGTNDAFAGDSAATIAGNLSTEMDNAWAIRQWPWFQLLVCDVLKRYDDPAVDLVVQQYNALVPSVIASKAYASSVRFVSVYNAVSQANYFSDGLHLLDAGSNQLADAIWPQLELAVGECR